MDAQLQQAVEALKAADASGNVEDATKLAQYISTYKSTPVSVAVEPSLPPKDENYPDTYGGQLLTIPSLIPDAIAGLGEKLGKRAKTNIPTAEERMADPLKAAQKQSFGAFAVGGAIDVLTQGVETGLETLGLMIPDSIGEPTKKFFAEKANALLNTELGGEAIKAFEGGAEGYKAWKKKNPFMARDVEAVINTAVLFTPTPKANPVSNSLGAGGRVVTESGESGVRRSRERFINELIEPEQTPSVMEANLAQTEVSGLMQTSTVRQTADEAATSKLLQGVKDVGYSKTLKANWLNIRKDIRTRADKLIDDLETFETNRVRSTGAATRLEQADVTARLRTDMSELIATNPLIRGQKPLEDTAEALLEKTLELLKDKPLTPANLIRARQDLDKYILDNKGTVFSAVDENALSVPFKTLRRTLNNLVDETVPSAKVKDSLKEQTLMYGALDNLAPKAAKESSNILGRAGQNVAKVLPYDAQRSLWLLATAAGTGVSFPALIPYMAGGVVLKGASNTLRGSGAYGQTKRGVGAALKAIDKAIKVSTNTAMIKQLKADRVYIADLLKNIETVKEGEGEGVPELLARPQQ
tara:strand:+ start:1705 stop:3459 length:1755 start_codon:yes stop_codon:yes gene_type:complete